MKVAIVNKHVSKAIGGSEIQCDLIARGLRSLGHDVIYIAIGGYEGKDEGYLISSVKGNPTEVIRAVIKERPDVVYFRSNRDIAASCIRRLKKNAVPTIYAVSNRYDLKPTDFFFIYANKIRASKNALVSSGLRRSMNSCDAITVLNPEYADLSKSKRLVPICNAMEDVSIPFNWEKPYCLWAANLKEVKRPELYVNLAKSINRADVDFLMVGSEAPPYEWIKDRDALPKNLHFLGKRDLKEVNGMMKNALFHIHTGHPEGFGNIFIQAWMYSKPSVSFSFDPGGFIDRYVTGRVSSGNVGRFVQDVSDLIDNAALCKELGRNARSLYERFHTPSEMVLRIESLMIDILNNQKRPQ